MSKCKKCAKVAPECSAHCQAQHNPPSSLHQCHYKLFSVHDPPWTQIHSILLLSSPCVAAVYLKWCSVKTKSLSLCLILLPALGRLGLLWSSGNVPHWTADWLRVCREPSPQGDQAEQGELCSAEEITLAGTQAAKGFLRSTCVWQRD